MKGLSYLCVLLGVVAVVVGILVRYFGIHFGTRPVSFISIAQLAVLFSIAFGILSIKCKSE